MGLSQFQKKILILFGVFLSNLAVALESFGITVSSRILQGFFAVDANWTSWLTVIYLFGMLTTVLLQDCIGSILNYKKRCQLALLSAGILTFFCLFVSNFIIFSFFRFFLGVLGGVILSHSAKLLADFAPEKELPKFIRTFDQHIYEICLGLSALLGGVVSQYFDWRSLFYIEIIFYFISWIILTSLHKEPENLAIKKEKPDWKGYFLVILLTLSLNIYIGQLKEPWNTMGFWSTFSWIFLILTVFLGRLLIKIHTKEVTTFFPIAVVKNPYSALGVFAAVGLRLVSYGPVIFFSKLFYDIYGYQYSVVGLMIGSFAAGLFFLGFFTHPLFYYFGISAKYLIFCGIIIVSVGCFLTRFVTILSEPRFFIFLILFYSLGVSFLLHGKVMFENPLVSPEEKKGAIKLKSAISLITSIQSGVILKTVIVYRYTYHFLIFSEQAGQARSKFFYLNKGYEAFSQRQAIPGLYSQAENGKVFLIDQLNKQAFLAGFGDFCFLLGIFFILSLVFFQIFFLRFEKNKALVQSISTKDKA